MMPRRLGMPVTPYIVITMGRMTAKPDNRGVERGRVPTDHPSKRIKLIERQPALPGKSPKLAWRRVRRPAKHAAYLVG